MLALTPVAALMFRFNNPDALLVMLLVASAYCLTRALEEARTRWIVATGALLGFAFLTKMGQALLVVPGFGLAYLVGAPTGAAAAASPALLAGLARADRLGGWWVAIVALLPASSRPFIDGSPDNNIFNLIFGYNGLSRLFGGRRRPGGRRRRRRRELQRRGRHAAALQRPDGRAGVVAAAGRAGRARSPGCGRRAARRAPTARAPRCSCGAAGCS